MIPQNAVFIMSVCVLCSILVAKNDMKNVGECILVHVDYPHSSYMCTCIAVRPEITAS